MSELKPTNAVTSGVTIDPVVLRSLMELKNGPGIRYMMIWAGLLLVSGYAVFVSQDSYWIAPAVFAYGTVLTVPAYAISHESAHSTFVKTKWLNTVIYWMTSLIYLEDPTHRYRSHMRHHNYTWINGVDTQMPFKTPLNIRRWLLEISSFGQYIYDFKYMILNALGIHDTFIRSYMPEQDIPLLKRDSRLFLLVYTVIIGGTWYFRAWDILMIYFVLPRIVGGISMQFFTIIQHAEMEEDQSDLRRSCRSFDTNWLGRFLYCDMNRHIEHHLYPKVPFHALTALQKELGDQLPKPGQGAFVSNFKVLRAVCRRSLGYAEAASEAG